MTHTELEQLRKNLKEKAIKPYGGAYGISRERGMFEIKDDAEYMEMLRNELDL